MTGRMLNQKFNLHLTLNKSLTNLSDNGPYTPLDQTLKTPIEPNQPNFYASNGVVNGNINTFGMGMGMPGNFGNNNGTIYMNPNYNESDDILTDADEPSLPFNSKTTKNYTLNFTTHFDQLLLNVYHHILSLPTTTPFSGTIPPSGLVSKVSNETMNNVINNILNGNNGNNMGNNYDHQRIINSDFLKNLNYQSIFLQLIRKRLIELCSSNKNLNKLPSSTSISVTTNNHNNINHSSISNNSSISSNNSNNGSFSGPYGNNANVKQSSISNLSLTDLNINNFQQQSRSRSSSNSVNLRKQSLTRNNSYSNNWLHVGNLNTIKQSNSNELSESLTSMQDFVPQTFIQRLAITPTQPGFNNMMMDYHTPPSSNKSSFSTPPQSHTTGNHHNNNTSSASNAPGTTTGYNLMNVTVVQNVSPMDYDDFNFSNPRSRSSSNSNISRNFPKPLTINTDNTNLQAMHGLNNGLESPFMSATTPSEEFILFQSNSNPNASNNGHNGITNNNTINNANISFQNLNNEDDKLPSRVNLNEKKRDSLKLKRGIL